MPETIEIVCQQEACELDMFEMHYTYDMPESVGISDFVCPYCKETDQLAEVSL